MCIRDSYICARKLDNRPLAKELENLYGPMDDTPYYYCTPVSYTHLDVYKRQTGRTWKNC